MDETFLGEAFVFELTDQFRFRGREETRVTAEDGLLPIGAVPDGTVFVNAQATGRSLEIDSIDVQRWDIPDPNGGTAIVVSLSDDDADSSGPVGGRVFTFRLDGVALPNPAVGQQPETFLNLRGIATTDLDLQSGPFTQGNTLAARDVAALSPVTQPPPGGTDGIGQGLSVERAQTIALLYETALDRDGAIDFDGLNFWIDVAERGFSDNQIAALFIRSDEFIENFGRIETLSNQAYVTTLYFNALDRLADREGNDFWVGTLDQGATRASVLVAFATSLENRGDLAFIDTLAEIEPGIWDFVV